MVCSTCDKRARTASSRQRNGKAVGSWQKSKTRCCGSSSLNAARIVYTINEDGPIKRYGFAYGTLLDHSESGEERFSVEWHSQDSSIWYDLFAFSRPHLMLAKLGYPLTRWLQRRFREGSQAAMAKAVG